MRLRDILTYKYISIKKLLVWWVLDYSVRETSINYVINKCEIMNNWHVFRKIMTAIKKIE